MLKPRRGALLRAAAAHGPCARRERLGTGFRVRPLGGARLRSLGRPWRLVPARRGGSQWARGSAARGTRYARVPNSAVRRSAVRPSAVRHGRAGGAGVWERVFAAPLSVRPSLVFLRVYVCVFVCQCGGIAVQSNARRYSAGRPAMNPSSGANFILLFCYPLHLPSAASEGDSAWPGFEPKRMRCLSRQHASLSSKGCIFHPMCSNLLQPFITF